MDGSITEINNYMEVCVRDTLNQVLTDLNACKCDRCKMDIMAIALNDLPPKYVVTRKGELYTKLSMLQMQFTIDVLTSVTKAAKIVARNPRHDTDINE